MSKVFGKHFVKKTERANYKSFFGCSKEDFFMNAKTKTVARAGIIAALYVVLSLIVLPVASGAIQFRLSEGLTLLALIFPEAPFALFVGCLLINVITGCAIYDVVFGSLITLVAGALTFFTGKLLKSDFAKIFIGGLFPVLLNAFLLPLVWFYCYGKLEYAYIIQVLLLLAGESVSVYAAGTAFYLPVKKLREKNAGFLS